MQSFNTKEYLACIIPYKFLLKLLSLLKKFRKISSLTEIHHQKQISLRLKGISQLHDKWMIDKWKYLLLSLNVPVQTRPKYSLFLNSFKRIKRLLPLFLDKIYLTKRAFSDSLVKLKRVESDHLDSLLLFDVLIHLEYVLLSLIHFVFVFLSTLI